MADDSNYRSYRQNDPFARPQHGTASSGAAGTQNDPLAELARLIGQNDPFADFGRGNAAPAPRHPAAEVPAPDWRTESGAQTAYVNPPPEPSGYAQYPDADPYRAAPPPPAYAPLTPDPGMAAPRYDGQVYAEQGYDQAPAFQSAYEPAAYGTMPADAPGYEPDPYYRDDARMRAPGEDLYDDAPPAPRRSRLGIALAVVGLAVVGTAGAYGYRTYFGGERTTQPPPVIHADAAPTKVVPPTQETALQSNKLINDRIVDPNQGERVVSREEKPVDIKSASPANPRIVFPVTVPNAPAAPGSASVVAPTPRQPSSVLGEPKRVRTVTIRPDRPAAAPPPPTPVQAQPSVPPPAPPPRIASAPAVSVDIPPATPRPVAPRRVEPAPQPVAPPSRSSDAPLSLAPQSAPPALAPARSRTRTAAAPSAPLATAAVSSGGYNVQVSSQRSEADAQASFRSLQGRYPDQLGGRSPIIRRVDLGTRGIYFRAMVGPFASAEQASTLCASIKSAGGQCVVQRN